MQETPSSEGHSVVVKCRTRQLLTADFMSSSRCHEPKVRRNGWKSRPYDSPGELSLGKTIAAVKTLRQTSRTPSNRSPIDMPAEIIAIGDELVSGERLDTNSQWLSQRLNEIGIRVLYHTTVGDELEAMIHTLQVASQRADTVICTGGLGPTADDLTREALAKLVGVELELREEALAHIRNLFARRQRPMPERNVIQAMFPSGSQIIPNPHGSAPGIDLTVQAGTARSRFFALPGVPAEMREMWAQTVEPALLANQLQRRMIQHRRVKCFGVGESDLEAMLPDLIRRGRVPAVGITVHQATITLRITAEGESVAACDLAMKPTLDIIHQCLGELVFGTEDDELQHAVIRALSDRGQTLAVAETGPGGMLSYWLSEADPTGQAFRGGLIERPGSGQGLANHSAAQQDTSSPPNASAARPIPASAETEAAQQHELTAEQASVAQMAIRCRERFQTDYGLAIGPFPTDPVHGQVTCALVDRAGAMQVKTSPYGGHPDVVKSRATKLALNLLRLRLHG